LMVLEVWSTNHNKTIWGDNRETTTVGATTTQLNPIVY
jgi:hypothetical protein